jgi:hypothetical protein
MLTKLRGYFEAQLFSYYMRMKGMRMKLKDRVAKLEKALEQQECKHYTGTLGARFTGNGIEVTATCPACDKVISRATGNEELVNAFRQLKDFIDEVI